MKRQVKVALAFIGSLWIAMPLYILLHEGGHALVASLCGAKIIELNIMEAYVVAEGGTFNVITLGLFYVSGTLVPMVILTLYLLIYPRETNKDFYSIFSALFTGMILFSMGVWVIVPIQYMLGIANAKDDVIQFIKVLNINPLIVVILASILMGIYTWIIWKKRIFQNGYSVLK